MPEGQLTTRGGVSKFSCWVYQFRGAGDSVSGAGYYAWVDRPESRRTVDNRMLLTEICSIHRASRETYGSPSI